MTPRSTLTLFGAEQPVELIGEDYDTPAGLAQEWVRAGTLQPVAHRVANAVQEALKAAGFVLLDAGSAASNADNGSYLVVKHASNWRHPDSVCPFQVSVLLIIDYAKTWTGRVVLATRLQDEPDDAGFAPAHGVLGQMVLTDEVRVAAPCPTSSTSAWEMHVLKALNGLTPAILATHAQRIVVKVDERTTP
jgi:hypothetical protein